MLCYLLKELFEECLFCVLCYGSVGFVFAWRSSNAFRFVNARVICFDLFCVLLYIVVIVMMCLYDVDVDVWDDIVFVCVYDDVIVRYGVLLNVLMVWWWGLNEDECVNDVLMCLGDVWCEVMLWLSEYMCVWVLLVLYYYVEMLYGDEYEYEYGRRASSSSSSSRWGYDLYDVYGGYYVVWDEDYGYFEDEFVVFLLFRCGRGLLRGLSRGSSRGSSSSFGEYGGYFYCVLLMMLWGICVMLLCVFLDMMEFVFEMVWLYEDDGYDSDEFANLFLSWYYAGYYMGSFFW